MRQAAPPLDPMAPMPAGPILRLAKGAVEVDLAPTAGGRIAQIRVDGIAQLIGPGDGWPATIAWGCYPMVPWAGRLREGRFRFEDRGWSLPVNLQSHAIHGVGFALPWRVDAQAGDRALLSLALPTDERWPFGGIARQSFLIEAHRVRLGLSVQAGARAMPAVIGWHPWFRKPDRLLFAPERMYPRDEQGIASLPLVPAPRGPWDDCFLHAGAVVLQRGGQQLRLSSECTHWVVYDGTAHATCVEPQTGPPDAFNLAPTVLAPGQSLEASFLLEWSAANA